MFTGIIQEIGKIKKIEAYDRFNRIEIISKIVIKNKKIGQSISVNGVCITITELKISSFKFEAMKETIELTNLKNLKIRDIVNLEAALTFHQNIDGHLIQGHIDALGEVINLKILPDRNKLSIKFPKTIGKYLAFKGSITINGVSLTISALNSNYFEVELIPYTFKKTNLKCLKSGDLVNIETDLIAKHLERLLQHKEKESSYFFLKERNLI